MKKISYYLYFVLLIVCSCQNPSYDKALITEAEKLSSPKGNFILYKYFIESEMAFGEGFTVMNIINSKEKCDFTNRDILRLGNNVPFFIKWKNENTILIKCLIDGGELSNQQPLKTEIKKWKQWNLEIECYTMYSASSTQKLEVQNYSFNPNSITLKLKEKNLTFKNENTQLVLDKNKIYLKEFKIDTFNSKFGLSFTEYEMKMKNGINLSDFKELQPFIKTKIE